MKLFGPNKVFTGVILIAVIFSFLIPVYPDSNILGSQIELYSLFASFLGFIIFMFLSTNQVNQFRITVPDIIILFGLTYEIVFQIFSDTSFDIQSIYRMLSGYIIFIFFKNSIIKIGLFFNGLILAGLIEIVIIILELSRIFSFYPDSIYLINGSYGNPNVVALFLSLLVPIIFYRIRSNVRGKILNWILILLFISCIIITKCRSAIILVIFSTACVFHNHKFKKAVTAILGSGLVIILVTTLILLTDKKTDSNVSRILIWKVSFDMIKKKPFTGCGIKSFEKEYNLHQSQYLKKESVTDKEIYTAGFILQPYNEFLYSWITGGFFKFLFYVAINVLSIFYLFKNYIVKENNTFLLASVSLCGLFLISLFSYTIYIPVIEMFLYVHLGIIASIIKPLYIVKINRIIRLSLLISISFLIGCLSGRQLFLNHRISKFNVIPITETDKKIRSFKKLFPSNKKNPHLLFSYSLTLLKAGYLNEAALYLKFAKNYSSNYQLYYTAGVCYYLLENYKIAEENFNVATSLYPSKFHPFYALFKLYMKQQRWDDAYAIAVHIDNMPVRINSVKIQEIKNEVKSFINRKSLKK